MIERGGVADLVLLEEDADPQSPDLSGSEIIVEVRAGQIVSDRRGR
jgi:hypothetical protein